MKYRVIGDTMPAVEVMFDAPGRGCIRSQEAWHG